jgi:hypothetical protein
MAFVVLYDACVLYPAPLLAINGSNWNLTADSCTYTPAVGTRDAVHGPQI